MDASPSQRYNGHAAEKAEYSYRPMEGHLKKLPNALVIVAALALLVGLIVRLVQTAMGVVPFAYGDPIFYWRGAMALVAIAIAIVLIQIRDK